MRGVMGRFLERLKDSLFLWLLFAPLLFGFLIVVALIQAGAEKRKGRRSSA